MKTAATAPVLTVTLNPAIDINLTVPDLPDGDMARATATRRSAGGKGVNVARVLAELGVAATAFCLVGGPDAQVFLSLLADAPFEVQPFTISQPTRTNVTLTVERHARHIKINQPGPRLSAREWRAVEAAFTALLPGRQWVVLSGALPPGAPENAYARLTRLAHRAGARVTLDCAGSPMLKALAQRPDLIKPNRAELTATLGRPCRSRRAALLAAAQMRELGAGCVVASHGAGECLAVAAGEALLARPPHITPGSPMGAGDSLVAGLVAALWQGESLAEALRLGVACGAACASAPDTVLALRPQIRRLMPHVEVTPVNGRA